MADVDPVPAEGQRLRGPWWWSQRRQLTEEQRREVLAQLFFEGGDRRPFLSRFSTLLALSVIIAVLGLAIDSSPVVIGAMLVSPLTTPILSLATSLVLGWPRRQLESVLIIAAGTVAGVGLAWVVMWILPEPQTVTLSSQELLSRTEPGLLDLAIAVAAGAAGAYILVRREAVSALPGVAIAVALVPPLASIGMLLELGRPELASGALLLYLTNLAGIVLAAGVVLIVAGVLPRPEQGRLPTRVRVGIAAATAAVVAVGLPLASFSRQNIVEAVDQNDADRTAREWAEGTAVEVRRVDVDEDDARIVVEVAAPRRPPPAGPLARDLASQLEKSVDVTVRWTPLRSFEASGTP